jgi:formylglycine-generating enzyme required for sulfatase activity
MIGGVAATSVNVVNANTVTATTPSGIVGSQTVTVTTAGGIASLSSGFTYLSTWFTVIAQSPDSLVVPDPSVRAAILATGLPWRVRDNGTQIEMVLIPPGTFNMGCSASSQSGCSGNENPVHSVTLTKALYIGRYEVTQGQWLAKMGSNPSYFQPPNTSSVDLTRPVEQVSWATVQNFLSATGLRLPTEAEWEYAYRAGTVTAFHGSSAFPTGTSDDALIGDIAWFGANNGAGGTAAYGTKPVGQKSANGFGLHDMAGNVWEWVSDWFSTTYYASSPAVDPAGPTTGTQRVLRGGAWSSTQTGSLRASHRNNFLSGSDRYGFRVARSASDPLSLTSILPNFGSVTGGTLITITGTNLTGTSSVTIGGAAATNVSVVNATTVTALTPPGTVGPQTVVVTTPTGAASLVGGFTYVAVPTISSVSPSLGSTIGGTPITITGANLTGTSSVTIGGVAATSVSVVNSTTVTAVTPAGTAGSKTVSVTTPSGTASLPNSFTYTAVWYTVLEQNPDPAVVTNATLRNAIIATGYPWRVRDNGTQIEMVLIPPGTFNMGCSASFEYSCGSSESPVHPVTLTSAVYMGRYEVTQAQWIARMGTNPSHWVARTENGNTENTNRPVEQVSWNQIVGTGGFLWGSGLRLPTEAEWEYACRAGTTTAFHGFTGYLTGTNDDTLVGNIAWFPGNNGAFGTPTYGTNPVGQKLANGFGLFDMSGNVWEWVNDWYSSTYYASSPSSNPTGPATGTDRVLRGGSFNVDARYMRSSYRYDLTPVHTDYDIGFRVARTHDGTEAPEGPAIASVSPVSGSTEGGTPITITGSNLTGTSSVTIGGTAATSIAVVNSTTVTAVTPTGSAGAANVSLMTPGGTANLANGFTYGLLPSISSVTPNVGITAGGTAITIAGTNLTGTSSVTVGGSAATSVSVVNSTTVTATTPAGSAGAANVSLTTPYGTATVNGAFTYQAYGTPTISSVAPNSGSTAGGTPITITGTNLTGASSVTIGGSAATSVSVVNSTTVTAVTPAGTAGAKTVSLTTPGGTANLSNGFTYGLSPSISSVTPNVGPASGGTAITITGTNLTGTSSVTVGGSAATSVSVVNSTTVTATTPAGTAGAANVSLTTPYGTATANDAFTYQTYSTPTISSVAPNSGSTAGGTAITITGTNLTGTSSVTIGGAAATSVSVVNSTTVTAVTPAGTAGAKTVSVTTPGGTANLTNGFTYTTVWYTVLEQNPDPAVVTSATLRNAITATGYPWRVRDNGTQIEMVLIPPGTFNMGCTASNAYGCHTDETPVHSVTLTGAFYMGRYEVTQAQWQARMGSNPSYFQSASAQVPAAQVPNRPVEQVSWNMIAGTSGFLTGTGLRLPTEAEWEYACRAGTTTAFHGFAGYLSGTNDDTLVGNIAWYTSNSEWQTRPVGGKLANGFGLHDMSGNVWEWVNDWYSSSYYASSPSSNPTGPATGFSRVQRGGSYRYDDSYLLRSSYRYLNPPDVAFRNFGFRVSRTPIGTEAPAITSVTPASGSTDGGTLIAITGTNLTGTSTVTIGGTAATSVTVVNSTTVTAVTPTGSAGAANVSLTTPGGTATANGAYTYQQTYATPTVSSVSPASGPPAGGTPITITGTNLTGTSSVTIGGTAATSVTVVNATTVTAVTPVGTEGAKTVSVTTPGGTANLMSGFTYTTAWYTVLEQYPDPAVVPSVTMRNAIADTGYPWRVRDVTTQIEMVLIPPGTFLMGCSASNQYSCFSSENPIHSVTITNAFYIGRYEVTQAQWQSRMGTNPSHFQSASAEVPAEQVPNRPVEQVSWNMIAGTDGFLAGTGLRLPSEAEWEYACRAGTTKAFHGFTGYLSGTNDDTLVGNIAWYFSNSWNQTRPVGGKLANGFGLHDMLGNAAEWVNDWYSTSYYSWGGPWINPTGPDDEDNGYWQVNRVRRGGDRYSLSGDLRCSDRYFGTPQSTSTSLGFRVARTAD